jgi:single-strand DNA-binding protein
MSSYNRTILMGNLTRDPETRAVGETSVTSFTLAVNKRYKDKSGNWTDRASFIDCKLWGARGEAFAKYLSKGDPALVEGSLEQETWEDKDTGAKRSKIILDVQNFEFVGGGQGSGGDGAGKPRTTKRAASVTDPGDVSYADEVDPNDIPF